MSEYRRLSDEELNDFTSRVVVQLEPSLTQQVMSLILELSEYRTKIENGTLIEIPPLISYNEHLKKYEVLSYDIKIYVKEYCKTEAEAKKKLEEVKSDGK